MTLDDLKKKRETLKARLAQIDARIAKTERDEKERETRELLRLVRERGLTADKIRALLDAGQPGETATRGAGDAQR